MALPGEPKDDSNNSQNNNSTNSNANDAATPNNAPKVSAPDQDDKDFDPSAEALIHEMDDERTLEEEEALDGDANAATVQNELDDLKRESEMPIEELLAYYNRMRNEAGEGEQQAMGADSDEADDDDDDDDEDEEEDGEESVTEVRKKQGSKDIADASKCDDELARTNNAKQQTPQLLEPSLPNPPQQQQLHTDSSIIYPTSASTDSVQQRTHQQINPARETAQTPASTIESSNPQSQQQQQQSDSPEIVPTTGRSKHSMTEFMIEPGPGASNMFRKLLDYDLDDSDDMDEDYSYTDDEIGDDERDWRRVIHVGPEHQAEVPEDLSKYEGNLLPYENEDKLVWRCSPEMTQEQVLEFLKQASTIPKRSDISISAASVPKISEDSLRSYRERMQELASSANLLAPEHNHENINLDNPPDNLFISQSRKRSLIAYAMEREIALDDINQASSDSHSNHVTNSTREDTSNSASQDARPELSTEDYFQDEEQLLYLLLQCNYNIEETLRRRRLDPSKYYLHEPMSLWSQDECLGFEHGLRLYGKDFYSIRQNKVPTRSRADVVAFYYLWKKSERHDVYTNQYRLDRKRSLSHPGTTDYMDKFIEDNESCLNASTSTPTPTLTDSTVDINQVPSQSGNPATMTLCHVAGQQEQTLISCLNANEGAENTNPTSVSLQTE